jgi:raffinose/stachyose/melibiose transport system permease protein
MKKKNIKQRLTYFTFTGPSIILYCLFILWPLGLAIYYSLQDWNGISTAYNFVGIQNYINVFKEKAFINSILFTLNYMAVLVILLNLIGLLTALALNTKLKLRGLLRTAFFVPIVISAVVVGYMWNIIVSKLFPYLGNLFGIEMLARNWLAYPGTAYAALIIATVWQSFGYYMIIYLTGLQSVPRELLEAAEIDGASKWKKFFHVTVPIIRPTFTVCIFLSIVNGLKAFDMIYSLTSGGPFGSTNTISFQIYTDAFKRDMLSYASAKAIIFCIMIIVISLLQVFFMRRKETEA